MPNTKEHTSVLRARLVRLTLTASVSCMAAFSSPAWSQSISLPDNILPEENGESSRQVEDTPRADWRSGTYGPVPQGEREAMIDGLPPFGANLFTGGFRGAMGEGLNPAYQVKPGDQVTVRAWGAIELDRALPVDAQGNIFLPGIGPINIEGQNSQQVDNAVRRAITAVYSDSVEVYTNLQGVQPVALFVTGNVENPGRYAGTPNDSLLYFLDQAGGIDQDLGSYRQIHIKRNNETIASVDLYDFLLTGSIPRPQFRDGDTIVVQERGPAIAVTGDVHREHRYELVGDQLSGAEILNLARTQSGVSHVLLRGNRDDGPIANYFPINLFAGQTVRSGDEIMFSADKRSETIVVEVEGSYYGPSRYALPRDA
ncbi:MAG: polysaccharide biosynthesis/export family protein, partial [Pseudomonadota bacterium]